MYVSKDWLGLKVYIETKSKKRVYVGVVKYIADDGSNLTLVDAKDRLVGIDESEIALIQEEEVNK